MKVYHADCQNCFFRNTLCKCLSAQEFDNIFKVTQRSTYKKGDVMFKQGEKADSLVFLTKGLVKLVYNNYGKDLIFSIERGQTLLGLANILNEDINLFSIVAIEDCKGCVIDIKTFKEKIINNRRYMLEVMGISTTIFRKSIFNFISIAHKQSNGRIADILIFLAENIYMSNSFSLSLSRQELAEFAGCSKELVINSLRNFNTDGIINVSGKKIEILDMERLYVISRIG